MKVRLLLPQPINSQTDSTSIEIIDGDVVFIRFVSGEIDEHSHVAAGLFCAATNLHWSDELPDYELDALADLAAWFNDHMETPFDYLPRNRRYDPAVCWFKSAAREHLAHAWELVTILDRNGVFIWTVKSEKTGYVHYEDEVQVFARPYPDVRLLLKR